RHLPRKAHVALDKRRSQDGQGRAGEQADRADWNATTKLSGGSGSEENRGGGCFCRRGAREIAMALEPLTAREDCRRSGEAGLGPILGALQASGAFGRGCVSLLAKLM